MVRVITKSIEHTHEKDQILLKEYMHALLTCLALKQGVSQLKEDHHGSWLRQC